MTAVLIELKKRITADIIQVIASIDSASSVTLACFFELAPLLPGIPVYGTPFSGIASMSR
jgi:hypothetical protein